MFTIMSGVVMFVVIIAVLVGLILVAKRFLVQEGDVTIGVLPCRQQAVKRFVR